MFYTSFPFSLLPLVLAGVCLLIALAMVLPLLRREDERRRLILSRTAAVSFYFSLALLLLDGSASLLGWNWAPAPFACLCLLSLCYAGALAHFSRKYGD